MNTRPFWTCLTCLLVSWCAGVAFGQPVAETIADRVVRFHASAEARDKALPSFALQKSFPSMGPAPDDFPVAVAFGRDADRRRWTARIEIEAGTTLYGTGQVSGQLRRNGRVVETWNTDAYGYQDDDQSLYTSHPWVLAVRADGSAFGVLADTTYRCEIDLREGIAFAAIGREQPVIVIDADSPQDVMRGLGMLTGTITMPPKWAIGYHQCRYSYEPDTRVLEIAEGFRSRKIPADVIWMDIDYMDGYRCFTFDPIKFSDPAGLNATLKKKGFHNVWMIDPGLKREQGYSVYDSGTERDVWVRNSDGQVYEGEVWPGVCVFPDYMNADVRSWWADLYKPFMAHGISGVWNDMNEPAVFNTPTKTMPETNVHNADEALGGRGTHARYHNVYGMMMVKSSREGVMAANPDVRPFVLSRANFIGGHRYAATWTGDNSANWYHIDVSIPMTLNLGLSGQPFCGPDIGGFAGNGDGDMFARWIGFGSLLPFSRGHTGKGNIDKEPWAFGPEVEATSRRALERRYRLLPHFYTLFREASLTGMPIARPTFFADPADPALRSEDDSFLLGDALLVVAQLQPARDRIAVMPQPIDGIAWREFDFESSDGSRDASDPDLPRLFARPGSIIPTGPIVQFVGEKPMDPLTLIITLDAQGQAQGELYEDAGEGWAYLDGEYLHTTYHARTEQGSVFISVRHVEGQMPRPARGLHVRLLMPDGTERFAMGIDAQELRIPLVDEPEVESDD